MADAPSAALAEAASGSPEAMCEVCGEAVRVATSLVCRRCRAPYHVDCWHFVGRCSIFGCDCTDALRPGEVAPVEQPTAVFTITEETRAPVRWQTLVEGLVRKTRARAVDIPKTVVASMGGAFLAYGLMLGFIASFGDLFQAGALEASAPKILMLGGIYGLVAPFLAPSQHRDPLRVAGLTLVAWLGCLFLARVVPYSVGYLDVGPTLTATMQVAFMGCLVAGILCASSVSEAVLGARTHAGERLRSLGMPARMGLAWVLTWLFIVPLHSTWWVAGYLQHPAQLLEVCIWALLAVGSGVTAIETGKAEYRKSIGPANETRPRRLPYRGLS